MITGSMIYWITRLDALHNFIEGILIISAIILILGTIGLIASWMVGIVDEDKDAERAYYAIKKAYWPILIFWIFLAVTGMLIPSTKEMIAIYAIPAISSNADVQEIPPKVAKFVNKQLQEWLEDITKEVKE